MSASTQHTEWLSLIDRSGAFLALPVLEDAFPQGLDAVPTPKRQRLRAAYEEWRDAVDGGDPLLPELHREWIRLVFTDILEYDGGSLQTSADSTAAYSAVSPERTESFSPDWVVISPSDAKPRLFVSLQSPGTDLEKVRKDDRWPASLQERMTALCRLHGVRLGLLTDGERWMLVNAPSGATSGDATWYARLWFQEPITLKAFQSLLGVRRCFGPAEETLEALLERSLEHQEEITDTLGEQVRRAVEVLVQCLDKADADRNRELLRDVSPAELYEAGLTVMMRLVFALCAEERGLLLSGDPVYDECYAVSTLRAQLADEADRHGPEVLERRHDAWARLLSVFRAVYGGIDHESLRMPALGGSLFDPDRFPFLEGRRKGTTWRDSDATPLPIDNRTVLLLLNSLQALEQHGGALLLSYRALDVEQIGHVYEGLLEHTVARVPTITLGLAGSKNAKNPNLSLATLESARIDGEATLSPLVMEKTGRSRSAICNALARPVGEDVYGRLLSVCGGDTTLAERIRVFANLLRVDAWGDPIVYRDNAFMVTLGADRRETGTHYTPKSLTETIVEVTLEPIVYVGPPEGMPREEWRLKTPSELLDLKICDPAMGSGAFLVQTCRWLAERLVEAWTAEEDAGKFVTADGEVQEAIGKFDPMPKDMEERLLVARRLVAERCLYGVDINPLAVELTKLSIWLVTLAKGRPFGFLDHNLRCGDSLLGIHRLDQLAKLTMNPEEGRRQLRLFGRNIGDVVAEVVEIRKSLGSILIRDINDVETMASMDLEARKKIRAVQLVADAMIGETLLSNGNANALDSALESLAVQADEFLGGNEKIELTICRKVQMGLSVDLPDGRSSRKPFHWPLEFPEVFQNGEGFDAMIGNPPYMGGKKISGNFGEFYRTFLVMAVANGTRGVADLCVFFLLRVISLLSDIGYSGLIATTSLIEGDTREVGLDRLKWLGAELYNASGSRNWPGSASVTYCMLWITKAKWKGQRFLNDEPVEAITSSLTRARHLSEKPFNLSCNHRLSHQGSVIHGQGFVLSEDEARHYMKKDPRNAEILFPYLRGGDFTSSPTMTPQAWVINFRDWPQEKASQYGDLYRLVVNKVKPERDQVKRAIYRERWWQYAEKQKTLYETIAPLNRVLFHGFTTKHLAFGFVPTSYIYAAPHVVIALQDDASFALLQSGIHETWVRRYTSYLGQTMRYIATDVFATFPFPEKMNHLSEIGRIYYRKRQETMLSRNEGLTSIYNMFNDPDDRSTDIAELRKLHGQLDIEAAKAYGWAELVESKGKGLGHGFYETKLGIRWMLNPDVGIEILDRLLLLNHQRYDEEHRSGSLINDGKIEKPKKRQGARHKVLKKDN